MITMQIDPVARRVRPISDFPEQLAEAVVGGFGFDPEPPPRNAADRLQAAGVCEHLEQLRRDPQLAILVPVLEALGKGGGDAGRIAADLRALAFMFGAVLQANPGKPELVGASYVVMDCLRSMAGRLSGLEMRACAIVENVAAEAAR